MAIEKFKVYLPTHWASALINGDYTGFDSEEEETQIENTLAELSEEMQCDWVNACDVSEESDFKTFDGLLTEVSEYTFIKEYNNR